MPMDEIEEEVVDEEIDESQQDHEEVVDEGGEYEPEPEPEPEPAQFGREQVEEMMAGFAEQFTGQFEQMNNQFNQALSQLRTAQQPQTPIPESPQPHPWLKDPLALVEAGGNPDTARFFQSMNNMFGNQLSQLRDNHSREIQELSNKFEAERLGRHFEGQRTALMAKYELPEAMQPLVDQLIVGAYTSMPQGGNPYQLNFENTIKTLAEATSGNNQAVKQAKAAAAAKQRAKPGGTPKSASPTKPGKPKREIKNMDDFDAMADAFSEEHFGNG